MIWLLRPSAVLDAFWARDLASPPLSPLASSSKGALCRCGEGMLPCGCTVSLPSPPSLTVLFDFHCYYYMLLLFIYYLRLERMDLMRSWVDIEVEKVSICVICAVRTVKVWVTFCGIAPFIQSAVHYF